VRDTQIRIANTSIDIPKVQETTDQERAMKIAIEMDDDINAQDIQRMRRRRGKEGYLSTKRLQIHTKICQSQMMRYLSQSH
jgi:hypothetical protein